MENMQNLVLNKVKSTKIRRIYNVLLDADGCIFNTLHYHRSINKNIILANANLLEYLANTAEQFDIATVGSFSLRSSIVMDKEASIRNLTGSSFRAIEQISEHLDFAYNAFRMTEVFEREDAVLADTSKLTLLYAQIHNFYTSIQNGLYFKQDLDQDFEMVFECFDDLEGILSGLFHFFQINSNFIPKNIIVKFNQYVGEDIKCLGVIQGTGNWDVHYKKTTLAMFGVAHQKQGYELSRVGYQLLHCVDYVTLLEINNYLLIKPDLITDVSLSGRLLQEYSALEQKCKDLYYNGRKNKYRNYPSISIYEAEQLFNSKIDTELRAEGLFRAIYNSDNSDNSNNSEVWLVGYFLQNDTALLNYQMTINDNRLTPLDFAIIYGKSSVAEYIQNCGGQSCYNNPQVPILWIAAYFDMIKVITNFLIKNKELVHIKNTMGYSLLHIAAIMGSIELAEYVIDQGIDIDHQSSDEPVNIVRLISEAIRHITCRTMYPKSMKQNLWETHNEVCIALCPDTMNKVTALDCAIKIYRDLFVSYLLKYQPKIKEPCCGETSILHTFIRLKKIDDIRNFKYNNKTLKDYINIYDNCNQSLLHWACALDQRNLIELFLTLEIDYKIRTTPPAALATVFCTIDKLSALDIARVRTEQSTIDLLLDYIDSKEKPWKKRVNSLSFSRYNESGAYSIFGSSNQKASEHTPNSTEYNNNA